MINDEPNYHEKRRYAIARARGKGIRRVYVAGPMTGIPQFNFPAFDAAAKELRDHGWEVTSPAELDDPATRATALASPDGAPGSGTANDETWGDFLARDVKLLSDGDERGQIDAIVVLPGWEKSRGARLETFVANRMNGKPILFYETLEEVPHAILSAVHAGEADLSDVPLADLLALEPGEFRIEDHPEAFPALNSRGTNPKDRAAQAADRAPLEYLEPVADEQIARVMKHGADKYGLRNYVHEPVRLRVYVGAMRRHLAAWLQGEDNAPDSGIHHLAHIGANVHVVLAALAEGSYVDDRHGSDDEGVK